VASMLSFRRCDGFHESGLNRRRKCIFVYA
jgi:hypothetical protein